MTPMSEHESKRIISEFKSRKTKQIALAIPLVGLFIYAKYLKHNPENMPTFMEELNLAYIILGCILTAVILSFINWRCPSCNSYLGKNISPTFCGSCGVLLKNPNS